MPFRPKLTHPYRPLPLPAAFYGEPRSFHSPKLKSRSIEITETKTVEITVSGPAFVGPTSKKVWCTKNEATIEETYA